ncbi:MAG: class I SAM-dependent methyltransferase [Bacteroidota bacterium]
MEKTLKCPACDESQFKDFLNCKDNFLTREEFSIQECLHCGLRFTNPRPAANEIGPYYESPDYIAHDAGKGTLIESVYKFVRKIALKGKFNVIKENTQGQNLLDIGCGTGEFLRFCQSQGLKVMGIEPSPKARNFAKQKYQLEVFEESQLELLPEASFDVITMWHVLEHVHNLNERFAQIQRLLKPGGTLLIAVPNSNSWDASFYRQFWAAYDLPRHLYHFTPHTLQTLLQKKQFTLARTIPLQFDAFYISLLSGKYRSGSQNYIKAIVNGFRSNIFATSHEKNYSSLIYLCKTEKDEK